MNDMTRRTSSFMIGRKLTPEEINICTLLLTSIEGITDWEIINMMISVTYNPYLVSEKEIIKLLTRANIETSLPTTAKKGILKSWIDKMGQNNKKVFGSKHLDCCEINRKQI